MVRWPWPSKVLRVIAGIAYSVVYSWRADSYIYERARESRLLRRMQSGFQSVHELALTTDVWSVYKPHYTPNIADLTGEKI